MQLLFFWLPRKWIPKIFISNIEMFVFYFNLQPLLNPLRIKLWITHHLIKVRVFVSSYCLDLVVVNFLVYTPTHRNSCSFLFFLFLALTLLSDGSTEQMVAVKTVWLKTIHVNDCLENGCFMSQWVMNESSNNLLIKG